jgi:hypothetical protein
MSLGQLVRGMKNSLRLSDELGFLPLHHTAKSLVAAHQNAGLRLGQGHTILGVLKQRPV